LTNTKGSMFVGLCALVLVLAPVHVFCADLDDGYVTLFLDEFDAKDPYWAWEEKETGTVNLRDGFVFLNITNKSTKERVSRATLDDVRGTGGLRWLYVDLEIRLRCSDDNKLKSGIGGGLREWGFTPMMGQPENQLKFNSASPESDEHFEGFYVTAHDDDHRVKESLTGVDMTEWHTYTVLWEEENGTLLVDGRMIATTNNPPSVPMGIWLFIENIRLYGSLPQFKTDAIDLEVNESLQIDYIRVFTTEERFQAMNQEISGLLSHASSLIEDLEQKGSNTSTLGSRYAQAEDAWQENRYFHTVAKKHIGKVIDASEHWDEISEMFVNASRHIDAATQAGMDTGAMERDYGNADKTWDDPDYELTKWYLQRVLSTQIPEPALLPPVPILGLILLPALLRRRHR
jgi:hypothetical protein